MKRKTKVWPYGIPEVGDKAERSRQVSHRDIELVTEMSGDRHRLHYDELVFWILVGSAIVMLGDLISMVLRGVVRRAS